MELCISLTHHGRYANDHTSYLVFGFNSRCHIVDNARYHQALLLKLFLSSRRAAVRLGFLPPYSPDLDPIERVWKLARRLATHNQYFPQLQGLVAAVDRQMEAWSVPNPILEKLCCIT